MKSLSCVRLLATPWTAAHQTPPSMRFSRQDYWIGVPLPSPFPRWLSGKESTCNSRDANQEIPRRRQWHPTPVPLPGKSHGWRSLEGCSPWGRSSRTRLSDFTFTFHFHALEKEMATHSSVLAWRIPGTGEPSGLPSMRLHRVGHD